LLQEATLSVFLNQIDNFFVWHVKTVNYEDIQSGEQVLRSTGLSSTIQIEEKNFDDLQKL
jgi:hypothetical protein